MLTILGDSHVIALADAMKQDGSMRFEGEEIRIAQLGHGYHFLQPFAEACDGGIGFSQEIARQVFKQVDPAGTGIIRYNDERRFVFVFGLYPSLVFDVRHWSRHTAMAASSERDFVSAHAFDMIIDSASAAAVDFFGALKAMNVRFTVASCCPVPASYWSGERRMVFAEHEMSFIYRRFRERVCTRLVALGVDYHLPPAEAQNEHEELLEAYVKAPGDYHANSAYGRLMLSKILRELAPN